MRISDWSSDVCSSDLHIGPITAERRDIALHPGQREQDIAQPQIGRCPRHWQKTVDPHPVVDRDANSARRSKSGAVMNRRILAAGDKTAAMDEQHNRRCHGFARRPDVEAQIVTVGARSEEHTSELQSLMRSSYAAFCLKKKKHDTHTNTL